MGERAREAGCAEIRQARQAEDRHAKDRQQKCGSQEKCGEEESYEECREEARAEGEEEPEGEIAGRPARAARSAAAKPTKIIKAFANGSERYRREGASRVTLVAAALWLKPISSRNGTTSEKSSKWMQPERVLSGTAVYTDSCWTKDFRLQA